MMMMIVMMLMMMMMMISEYVPAAGLKASTMENIQAAHTHFSHIEAAMSLAVEYIYAVYGCAIV